MLSQKTSQLGSSHTELLISNPVKQLSSDLSNVASKPEQVEACGLSRLSVCHNCGLQLDVRKALICDGCEAVHHVSCIQPILAEIPSRSWYCGSCLANGKTSPESNCAASHLNREIHHDCSVCRRLKDQTFQTCESETNFGDASISLESEESPECSIDINGENGLARRGTSRVCKRCKSGETDNMRFRLCQHSLCPYKYYHKRCLRSRELRRCGSVWYCPSCVCRNCHIDQDDDKITLCDGCDEAYHIYCMVPPLKSIPKGDWYCLFCTIELKMRQRSAGKLAMKGLGAGSMDVLLTAAEELHSER